MKTQMMAYILYVIVTLNVISYNSVFTQFTIDPEVNQTCEVLCSSEIQKMYQIITHLKDNISALEMKQEHMQSQINAPETNEIWMKAKSDVRNLTEQNENLIELKTNCTIIAEKCLHHETEIDDLRDENSAFKGNMSSLQSENRVLEQRINNLDYLLNKTAGISNMYNCADLYKLGHREDRVYTFELCDEPYQLYCDMTQDGGGWTVIQRRFDGTVDFYRNWDAYKTGFGNLSTEFWLGNGLTSNLTKNKKFNMYIYLEDFEGEHRYAQYSDFLLGDEEQKYVLNIGTYSGDAGDALNRHRGMKFSTYDSDNDISSSTKCASRYHGAFWFNYCHHAHLNGQYSATSGGAGFAKGLVWRQWKGMSYSLKKTTMKIRPMDF